MSVRYIAAVVECVATGTGHDDRDVAWVALVDDEGQTLLDLKVALASEPVDYLTPYSGLTAMDFEHAIPFEQVQQQVRAVLQETDTVLVGQTLDNVIRWLGLEVGIDFSSTIDLAKLFQSDSGVMYSLAFAMKTLHSAKLAKGHSAVKDATNAMKLFTTHGKDPAKKTKAKKRLEKAWGNKRPGPRPASYKGICLMKFNAKRCICQPKVKSLLGPVPFIGSSATDSACIPRQWDTESDYSNDRVQYASQTMWQAREHGTFDPHENYSDDYDGIYGDFYGNYGGKD